MVMRDVAPAVGASDDLEPRIVHALPGRVRVRISEHLGHPLDRIEWRLGYVRGVRQVRGNTLTGTLLVHFDPAQIDQHGVLRAIRSLTWQTEPAGAALDGARVRAALSSRPDSISASALAEIVLDAVALAFGVFGAASLLDVVFLCLDALGLLAALRALFVRAMCPTRAPAFA